MTNSHMKQRMKKSSRWRREGICGHDDSSEEWWVWVKLRCPRKSSRWPPLAQRMVMRATLNSRDMTAKPYKEGEGDPTSVARSITSPTRL